MSGLARCGHCGKALVGQEAKGGKFSYYVCGTLLKKGSGSYGARYLNTRKFEELVINKVKAHILTEENLRELARVINEEMDSSVMKYREELDVISAGITEINSRLERLYDALETGKIELDDLSPRIRQLRRQQQQLQARKWELEALLEDKHKELVDLEMVARCADDLRNLLDESSIAERKSFVRSFIKEIKVIGKEVLLTYTIPLPPEGTSEERASVLYSVHPSGAEVSIGSTCKDFNFTFALSI